MAHWQIDTGRLGDHGRRWVQRQARKELEKAARTRISCHARQQSGTSGCSFLLLDWTCDAGRHHRVGIGSDTHSHWAAGGGQGGRSMGVDRYLQERLLPLGDSGTQSESGWQPRNTPVRKNMTVTSQRVAVSAQGSWQRWPYPICFCCWMCSVTAQTVCCGTETYEHWWARVATCVIHSRRKCARSEPKSSSSWTCATGAAVCATRFGVTGFT